MNHAQDFTGLISEYVHSVMQDASDPELKAAATKTWNSLKRSTKCGPRRSVSDQCCYRCSMPFAAKLSWNEMDALGMQESPAASTSRSIAMHDIVGQNFINQSYT